MVAAYSWLALGCPAPTATVVACACGGLSPVQRQLVGLMGERVRYLGRAAGRVTVASGSAEIYEQLCKADLGAEYGGGSSALQVESAAVSLPAVGAKVDITALVPSDVAACLVAPGAFDLPEEDWPEKRPGCCTQVTAVEWRALLRRMLDNGMAVTLPEALLPRWNGAVVPSGTFGVPKNDGAIRLIVDRRWRNSMEVNLMDALQRRGCSEASLSEVRKSIRLLHGGMFAEWILGPRDRLSMNLDDLTDYYYLLRCPPSMILCGAMGPALSDDDLVSLGRVPVGSRHYACLTAPAMGDAKVPDLAQLVHQWVLQRGGVLTADRWM